MLRRRRLYRFVFAAAGIYNLGWGAYSALDPQWSFRLAGMPLLNHPDIYACLGMVVGLYGLIYLEIARAPEKGFALGAVGLMGKVFGPIGMAGLILAGTWPLAAGITCLTNDLIWWIPFGMYVRDTWPSYREELRDLRRGS